ncbi:hypothetical protein CBOM_07715 [Ceraceosorus bombacis]|uniref:Uncharacterized protein n=1 Tax=Ceraceosorus bombacis TaxID=401625 RepID=A0A0P1BGI4_9BASI|nr:hypothetical protein CBOM_07715 [Ceraceosorus bombacis]
MSGACSNPPKVESRWACPLRSICTPHSTSQRRATGRVPLCSFVGTSSRTCVEDQSCLPFSVSAGPFLNFCRVGDGVPLQRKRLQRRRAQESLCLSVVNASSHLRDTVSHVSLAFVKARQRARPIAVALRFALLRGAERDVNFAVRPCVSGSSLVSDVE